MAQLLFYVLSAAAIACGVGVVASKSPMRSILCLLGSFVALAIIYLLAGFQFLAAASLLSLGGGGLGLGLGALLSWLLDGRSLGNQSFQTSFSGDFAVFALVVGAAIDLFFGIYPASRAAKLDPITALGHES